MNHLIPFLLYFAGTSACGYAQEALPISTYHLLLKISDLRSEYSDETVIRFKDGSTVKYDEGWDTFKFFSPSNEVPSLYTIGSDGYPLSINTLPDSAQDWLIPVFTVTSKASDFILEISGSLPSGEKDHLYLALPQQVCYLEWKPGFTLQFSMPPMNGEAAVFFILLQTSGADFAGNMPCNLPDDLILTEIDPH